MRFDEDAYQSAWVVLLERGGPNTVRNYEAWLNGVARRIRVARITAEEREKVAWRAHYRQEISEAPFAWDEKTVRNNFPIAPGREAFEERKRLQGRVYSRSEKSKAKRRERDHRIAEAYKARTPSHLVRQG